MAQEGCATGQETGGGVPLGSVANRLAIMVSRTGMDPAKTESREAERVSDLWSEGCWLCGARELVLGDDQSEAALPSARSLKVSDSDYGRTLPLATCASCGLMFASRTLCAGIEQEYEAVVDEDYLSTTVPRRRQAKWLLDRALKSVPARGVLDVGAGMGVLVEEARARGLEAEGLEVCSSFRDASRQRAGVELEAGTCASLPWSDGAFDLVFLIDVLEHLRDPLGCVQECLRVLSPQGELIVVTPDVESLAARLMGRRWWHRRAGHINYFSRSTLSALADRAGGRVVGLRTSRWYFSVGYLAPRLARYLPFESVLGSMLRKLSPSWVVPFDLRDSMLARIRPSGTFSDRPR